MTTKLMKKEKKLHSPESVQRKFQDMREDMSEALIERNEEVDVVLTALICGENPLLVGPPGVAKSLLLDTIMHWMGGAPKFTILFNKYTTPEEVFGPISVKGLREDKYYRITTGKLPEAVLSFGDEVFKGSTAILNTLLRIINERVYENGDGSLVKVPLLMFIGASNEYPNDQDGGRELGALFDRFLFRKNVKPISSKTGRKRLLWTDCIPKLSTSISRQEIELARHNAERIGWEESAKEALVEIIEGLYKEGIVPGDRRQKKSVMAVQSYAFLLGSDIVEKEHLEILQHILWVDPNEQPQKCAKIVGKIANPAGSIITEKLIQIDQIVNESIPTEAVPKLKAIEEELKNLHVSQTNEKRLKEAKKYNTEMIKEMYHKVIGPM